MTSASVLGLPTLSSPGSSRRSRLGWHGLAFLSEMAGDIGVRKHAVLRTAMPGHDVRKRPRPTHAVITGLVPVIPLRVARPCLPKRDGRDIGVRKHAVLRTAM